MSLVHDALQKAEREKLRKTGAQVPPTPSTPRPFAPVRPRPVESPVAMSVTSTSNVAPSPARSSDAGPQKKPSSLLPMLIGIVAIVALVAIVFLVTMAASTFRDSKSTIQPKDISSTPASSTAAAVQPQEPTAAPMVATEPAPAPPQQPPTGPSESGFHLTGIMPNPDGKYMAILNGRVVSDTTFVEGATIKSIERDQVTLDVNGKKVVLRLQ